MCLLSYQPLSVVEHVFCGHARFGGRIPNQHPRCVGGASLFSGHFDRYVGPLLNALALLHVRLGLQCYRERPEGPPPSTRIDGGDSLRCESSAFCQEGGVHPSLKKRFRGSAVSPLGRSLFLCSGMCCGVRH